MSSKASPSERLTAFRVGSLRYPLLDGGGAAASDDARWNSRGRRIIYAAEHYATALIEKMAQMNTTRLPATLVYARIDLPLSAAERVEPGAVPGWDADDKAASQAFGDQWYEEQRSLALLVPSLAAPGLEWNVLINQQHSDFAKVVASKPRPIVCHPKLIV